MVSKIKGAGWFYVKEGGNMKGKGKGVVDEGKVDGEKVLFLLFFKFNH